MTFAFEADTEYFARLRAHFAQFPLCAATNKAVWSRGDGVFLKVRTNSVNYPRALLRRSRSKFRRSLRHRDDLAGH
jgi:hypothetical protein